MPRDYTAKFTAERDPRRLYLSDEEWKAFEHTETYVEMLRNACAYAFEHPTYLNEWEEGRFHRLVKEWLIEQATDFVYHYINNHQAKGTIYFRQETDAVNFRLHFHNANHTVNM